MKRIVIVQAVCFILTGGLFFSVQAQMSWDKFSKTGAWNTYQTVIMHPEKANFINTTVGEAILLGKPGATASLPISSGELRLGLAFMLSPNASATLTLPTGHKVKLNAQRSGIINSDMSGSIANNAPLHNATRAAGLWQTLSLELSQQNSGMLKTMSINGTVIQENVMLPPMQVTNTLALQVLTGAVAFRDVSIQVLRSERPISLSPLTYQVYKGWAEKPDQISPQNLLRKDTTSRFTYDWAEGEKNFSVIYEGSLDVAQAGDYVFDFRHKGHLWFELEGKNLLPSTWNEFLQKPNLISVSLTKGKHPFKLGYHKVPWRGAALGWAVSANDVLPYALNVPNSLPEPDPVPVLMVSPTQQAEMVRSFIQMEGETAKRTHALSVGTPAGVHYSLDLNRGSLLQFWRGEFANTTDMWYERGEPQLLTPMHQAITTKGQSDFALLPNLDASWPDSSQSLKFKGYRLTKNGMPIINYRLGESELTDEMTPNANELTRTITATTGYVKLASASTITFIEKGLYAINEQQYFVKIDPKITPIIRSQNGKQELILPLTGIVKYALIW